VPTAVEITSESEAETIVADHIKRRHPGLGRIDFTAMTRSGDHWLFSVSEFEVPGKGNLIALYVVSSKLGVVAYTER